MTDKPEEAKAASAPPDYEQMAQQILEDPAMTIIVIDLNGKPIYLKMVHYEMVLEIQEYLAEHIQTCFFTNYFLEHKGERLNEYQEIAEIDLKEDNHIYMRADGYDERKARHHIRRLKEILAKPVLLNAHSEVAPPTSSDANDDEAPSSPKSTSSNPMVKNLGKVKLQSQQTAEEIQKKNYQDFMKIIEREQKKDIPLPQRAQTHPLQELFANPIEIQMNKVKQSKCVESIEFSVFNPVPPSRKMAGDLFYLTVKTLDVGEQGITATVHGFYRNDSVEKSYFSPGPSTQRGNPCFSYTLIGTIFQLSPVFGRNLETYLKSILQTEPYFLIQPPLTSYHWIQKDNTPIAPKDEHAASLTPLFGIDPKGIRDWNEEYQQVKSFPKDSALQRIQRDRALHKVYNDFLDAATKGAVALVHKNLTAMNPNENTERHQVFVYNYIFFSFSIDLIDSFKDLSGPENNPSFSQSNQDIMGLRTLAVLDVDGLHNLATAIIQYKGQRVIAQSIIPGILNNTDLSNLTEYGSVDEQKTIHCKEEYHQLMLKVCEHLKIKTTKLVDGENNSIEIAGSTDVKGIRGTDNRAYFVDMQGLTPRDTNYMGEDYHSCVLRPELILIYQRTKNIEYASEKMQAAHKDDPKPEEEKKDEIVPKDDEKKEEEEKGTPEEKAAKDAEREKKLKEEMRKRQEEQIKKLQEFDKYMKEAKVYTYNTSLFKGKIKLGLTEDERKAQEAEILELGKFLKEQSLEKLVKDLQQPENIPLDSESLESAFHSHGVNMRYLGAVLTKFKDITYNHINCLLEKEIFLRSAKHIFNEYIRLAPATYISSVVSYLLNMVLAPTPFLDLMEEGKITHQDLTIQAIIEKIAPKQAPVATSQAKATEEEKAGAEANAEESAEPTGSKKKKKNKKKKPEGPGAAGEAEEEKKPDGKEKEYKDMLFSTATSSDFKVEGLFSHDTGLIPIDKPEVLSMKPSELYARIKYVAKARYSYDLPESIKDLLTLKNMYNKIALLRDLCRKLGIHLQNKDYIMENELQNIQPRIQAQHMANIEAQNQSIGKKKQKVQQLSEEQLLSFETLPFQSENIVELYPILKHIDIQNNEIRTFMQNGKAAYKEGQFERAFEFYTQAANLLLQIAGPTHRDVQHCLSRIANIQFKFGDFFQAIEQQSKSVILQERIFGYDHPQAAYSYSQLALFHHTCGYFSKAFEYMYRSLAIMKCVCGDSHPDISSCYLNLGLMYQDIENYQAALDCFLESLYRNIYLFGEKHIQVASCFQAIAGAYYNLQDYRKALEHQEKAHKILQDILPAEDQYLKSSQMQMSQYTKLSVWAEKSKSQKAERPIGSNKAAGSPQKKSDKRPQGNRLNALFQRLQNPRQRNVLDILEYNYLRQQQSNLAQRIMEEAKQRMEKPEDEKEDGGEKQEPAKEGETTEETATTTPAAAAKE